MRRIILTLTIALLCISLSSAFLEASNEKEVLRNQPILIGEKEIAYNPIWEKYAPISIDSWLGLGATKAELAIDEHTESCGADCQSTIVIDIYEDSPLIDGIKFYTIDGEDKYEQAIRSYQFYTLVSETPKEVNDYSNVCSPTKPNANGTIYKECRQELIGSHIEYDKEWKEYNIGDVMKAGTYTLKLEGQKREDRTVDWVITTQGKEISDWAIWGGGSPVKYEVVFNSTTTNGNNFMGWHILTNSSMYISKIERGNTASTGRITNNSGYVIDNSTTLDGNYFIMNNVTLSTDTYYFVEVYNTAGSSTQRIETGSWVPTLPRKTNSSYTIYNASQSNASKGNDEMTALKSITAVTIQASLTLNSPTNNTLQNNQSVYYNVSYNINGATAVNASLWSNSTGTWRINSTQALSGASGNFAINQNLSDGINIWGISICDSDGACGYSENRTITIDTISPVVTISSPSSVINYGYIGKNESLNYTITDTNRQSCWYQYENVNYTISCTANSTFLLNNSQSIIVGGNDSAGNVGVAIKNFTIVILQNSSSYSNTAYETESAVLSFNGSVGNGYSLSSVNLIYGSTDYNLIPNSLTDSFSVSKTLELPVTTGSSVDFYYAIKAVNSTTNVYINTTNFTQNIQQISLYNCQSGNVSVNFTIYNMINPNPSVNSDFYSNWKYWLGSGVNYKNYSFENLTHTSNSFKFCIYPYEKTFYVDTDLQYAATGFSQNHYYLIDESLSNQSKEFKLYLLNTSSSTITTFKVINSLQQGVADVLIKIYLYDVGMGNSNLVGMMKTNYNGQDLSYLNWYDTFYSFKLYDKNGALLRTLEPYKIGSSPQSIYLFDTTQFSHDKFYNIRYSLTYNNITNLVTLFYEDPSASITSGCLRVIQTGLNSSRIFDQCNNGSSGTILYTLPEQNGTYNAFFYSTGSYGVIDVLTIFKDLSDEVFNALGRDRWIFAFIGFIGIAFMGLISPVIAIVVSIVGLLMLISLGFLPQQMLYWTMPILIFGGYVAWKIKS